MILYILMIYMVNDIKYMYNKSITWYEITTYYIKYMNSLPVINDDNKGSYPLFWIGSGMRRTHIEALAEMSVSDEMN